MNRALRYRLTQRRLLAEYLRARVERTMRHYGWGSEGYTGRQPAAVRIRVACVHKLRRMGMSATRIGRVFGVDHTTILNLLKCRARRPIPPAVLTLRRLMFAMTRDQIVAVYGKGRTEYAIGVRTGLVLQMRRAGYSFPEIGAAMRRNQSTIGTIHRRTAAKEMA